jgi:hypothetical protein
LPIWSRWKAFMTHIIAFVYSNCIDSPAIVCCKRIGQYSIANQHCGT